LLPRATAGRTFHARAREGVRRLGRQNKEEWWTEEVSALKANLDEKDVHAALVYGADSRKRAELNSIADGNFTKPTKNISFYENRDAA